MASFSDDFNRPDSTDLGAGWVEVSGDWSIISQQLSSGSAGGTIILRAATPMASNDHYAQVTIAATAAVSHGVWCRGNANISQGYLWRNDGSTWNLFSVVGGSFSSIGSYAAPAAPGDVAKIQAVGSTIKGFVNGVERVSVVDTNVPTGTSTGIRAESVATLRFDDFTAADITAGTALGISSSVDTAQPVTSSKTATPATASEADSAQPLTGTKAAALGTADAIDDAQPFTGTRTATLTPATATDTAQAFTASQTGTGTLNAASTVDAAMPLAGGKAAVLVPAREADAGRPLVAPSTTVPSPERTFRIPAEHRRLAVPAEHRTLTVR